MAIYILHEGITGLTSDEKEGLKKIKNSIKDLFKKKQNKKMQKRVNLLIPLNRADFDKAKKELLKALTRICKSYNDSNIKVEIFEEDDVGFIFEIIHGDQEFKIDHLGDLNDIGHQLEGSDEFKAVSEYANISVSYGDGDEGCLYICITQRRFAESANIFKYVEFI